MPTSIVAGEDRAGIFSAVRHLRFRPLWTASILSGVAYMTALTARGWVAFDLPHHSSTVGLVVFASFLSSLIITRQRAGTGRPGRPREVVRVPGRRSRA